MSEWHDPNARMAHARSFQDENGFKGKRHRPGTKHRMSVDNRRRIETDVAAFLDAVCARRVCSLADLSRELECDHSYLTRLRDGSRVPARKWVNAFTEKCHLTEAEKVTAYVLFGYIPPDHVVVQKASTIQAFRTDEV